MCVAISSVSGTPSAWITSNTISPQAAADSSNQFSAPYIRLPGVVIDVDDEAAVESGDAGAREIAALHDDDRVGVGVRRDRRRDLDAVHARELEVVLRRRRRR